MKLPKVLIAWCAATALVAGCGGGSGGGSDGSAGRPSASASPNEAAALLAVSRCMRANGYPNFPDPTQNPETGQWEWPAQGVPRKASTACDSLVRQAKSLGRKRDSQRVSAAEMAKLREFAKCMRQQGVSDWPDPDERGAFPLPARLGPPNGMKLVKTQDQACKKHLPGDGKIRIASPDSGGK